MSPALLASLVVTLAAIVALAVWTGAHNTKKKGEGSNAAIVAGVIIGTLVGGSSTVGTAQLAYTYGMSAWWFTLGAGISCLVLGLVYTVPLRRNGERTLVGMIRKEYGPRIGMTASVLNSVGTFINIISQILSATAVVAVIAPKLGIVPAAAFSALFMVLYADVLMCLKNQVEPYENEKGACAGLVDRWAEKLTEQFRRHPRAAALNFRRNLRAIAGDFDRVPCTPGDKVKVGIVGEIYVKYSDTANNHLEKFLLEQGCEVNVPGLLGFLLNALDHYIDDIDLYGGSRFRQLLFKAAMRYVNHIEAVIGRSIRKNSRLNPPTPYQTTRKELDGVLGVGCKMGEGWLLTAEMCELIHSGVPNIVCVQPFGCLPNHIAGKGTIRALREKYPKANIVPIDYDPGATRVNQENRLKLMLAVAREEH